MFNLTTIFKSNTLKIYYTEDFDNNDFLSSIDNTCYIFYQFTWNVEANITNFPFNYCSYFPKSFNVKTNLIFCAPNQFCKDKIIEKGYSAILLNHNCLIDYNLFNIENKDKIYDAVINSRPFWWKRVYLAKKVNNLCYIKGNDWAKNETSWNGYKDMNLQLKTEIYPNEVINIYNQSKVGLILSGNTGENVQGWKEGANYSSCEYLLCGLHVIITPSQGGRDFWFDDYNSIVCEPNEDSVNECVKIMLKRIENNEINREIIRNNTIQKMINTRKNLINKLQEIFNKYSINLDAEVYFQKIFFNKLTTYDNIKW